VPPKSLSKADAAYMYSFGIRLVHRPPISHRIAGQHRQYKQPNLTNHRYHVDEDPPITAIRIMQTPRAQCEVSDPDNNVVHQKG
jgi:hypothetical protein